MTVGNDCDSGVFNYMTQFSFLHYLEFDFLSLATKKLWTKNPPPFFFGIYFNHLWWDRETQADTVVHGSLTLVRSCDTSFLCIVFRRSEFGKHNLAEAEEWNPAPLPLLPICWGTLGEGDLLPLTAWLAYTRKERGGVNAPPSDHIQWSSAAGYLPPHGGCQWGVYFVINRQNKLQRAFRTQQVQGRSGRMKSLSAETCPGLRNLDVSAADAWEPRITSSWAQEPRPENISDPSSC